MCYDLVQNKVSARVPEAHSDEINSVCFANRQHSNIFLSGSDDTMVKVWDRRAISSNIPLPIFSVSTNTPSQSKIIHLTIFVDFHLIINSY